MYMFLTQLSNKLYTTNAQNCSIFLFIHRENDLKRPYILSYCSIQRDHFKKNLMQNLIKIYTKTHQIAHFFLNFLAGEHGP